MIPHIADNDDVTDFAAWLLTVPGIPAGWGCETTTAPLRPAVVSSFHKEAV